MVMKPGKAAPRRRPGEDDPAMVAPEGAGPETARGPDPWRPLPWHVPVWRRLLAAVEADRLHHALLFTGPHGTGKEHFARALAARLLCLTPVRPEPGTAVGVPAAHAEGSEATIACGTCAACASFAVGAHPLFSLLGPQPEKKDIALDEVRDLLARVALSGGAEHPRIALIHPPERLNTAGVNALLKTIEEPPGRLHLLLPTARPGVLPATLRSRLQTHRLPAPTSVVTEAWLREHGAPLTEDQRRDAPEAPLTLLAWHRAGRFVRHAAWNETLAGLAGSRLTPAQAASQMTSRDREENAALLDWLEADAHRTWRGAASLNQPPSGGATRARRTASALTDARQRLGQLNMSASTVVEPLLARRVAARRAPATPGRS